MSSNKIKGSESSIHRHFSGCVCQGGNCFDFRGTSTTPRAISHSAVFQSTGHFSHGAPADTFTTGDKGHFLHFDDPGRAHASSDNTFLRASSRIKRGKSGCISRSTSVNRGRSSPSPILESVEFARIIARGRLSFWMLGTAARRLSMSGYSFRRK